MNREKPDVSKISLEELQERQFPSRQDYRITISSEAYQAIYKHAKENTEVEICGVLIGEIFKDADGPYLEIVGVIKGEYAANQEGNVTFTHETWAYIHEIKSSEFPHKRIVGWYHSHPRYGIFLSPQDTFIHDNFFNQPWQVAFVIDPVSEEDGFFIWQRGEPVQIEQYWIDGSRKLSVGATGSKEVTTGGLSDAVEDALKRVRKTFQHLYILFALLVVIPLLVVYLVKIDAKMSKILVFQKQYLVEQDNRSRPAEQSNEESRAEEMKKLEDIKTRLAQSKLLSGLDIGIRVQDDRVWCYGEVYTLYHKELVVKEISSVEGIGSIDSRGVSATRRYSIPPGETLGKIAEKVYGNPDVWVDIFEANGDKIEDPNRIKPSVILSLPERELIE